MNKIERKELGNEIIAIPKKKMKKKSRIKGKRGITAEDDDIIEAGTGTSIRTASNFNPIKRDYLMCF